MDEQSLPQSTRDEAASLTPRVLLVFRLADRLLAIRLDLVQEILPMAELSRPPVAPEILAGFLNLEGQPVAVVRLSRALQISEAPLQLYTPLLVLRGGDQRVAWLVDGIHRTVSIGEADILPLREDESFNGCADALVKLPDGSAVLLSPERVLLEKERQCLAAFTAMEQARLRQSEAPPP